jgi:hypothetical protein
LPGLATDFVSHVLVTQEVPSEALRRDPGSPVGSSAAEAAGRRVRRSAGYQEARERLAPYEQLARVVIRRRVDLGLTQGQLAERT